MAPEQRNEALTLRLSKDEMQMLKGLAAITGLSQSDVLRQALRALWDQKQAKGPKPKSR
jgi:uncharacterized protein (DUF1778 family)